MADPQVPADAVQQAQVVLQNQAQEGQAPAVIGRTTSSTSSARGTSSTACTSTSASKRSFFGDL